MTSEVKRTRVNKTQRKMTTQNILPLTKKSGDSRLKEEQEIPTVRGNTITRFLLFGYLNNLNQCKNTFSFHSHFHFQTSFYYKPSNPFYQVTHTYRLTLPPIKHQTRLSPEHTRGKTEQTKKER